MEPGPRSLRREVMTPRRPSSSFGLIAVSTLAMVFAVSSSLLLFSAHRHRMHHCPGMLGGAPHPHVEVGDVRVIEPMVAPAIGPMANAPMANAPMATTGPMPTSAFPAMPPECKGPTYRSTGDGGTEVVFEQCPPRPASR